MSTTRARRRAGPAIRLPTPATSRTSPRTSLPARVSRRALGRARRNRNRLTEDAMKIRVLAAAAAAATLTGLVAGCDRGDADRVTRPTPPPQSTAPSAPPATAPIAPPPTAATPPATDRTVGEAVGDAAVTAKVKAALLAEKGVDGMKINVDTRDGNVTLSGDVPEQSQIERATQVARGIDGVKAVDNKLRVGAG